MRLRVDLGLIHYPVHNKNGQVIASAVTNLDVHDIARAAKTYGVDSFHVVTPLRDQQALVQEIVAHWVSGFGAQYNSKRQEALALVRIHDDLASVLLSVTDKWKERPLVLATDARPQQKTWSFEGVRQRAEAGQPLLILFGTAWGLAQEIMDQVDGFLPPIFGPGSYNHLSVRSAAAIMLDRLLARTTATGVE